MRGIHGYKTIHIVCPPAALPRPQAALCRSKQCTIYLLGSDLALYPRSRLGKREHSQCPSLDSRFSIYQWCLMVFVFVYHSSALRSGVGKLGLFEPGTYGTKVKDLLMFLKLLAIVVSRKIPPSISHFLRIHSFSPCSCLDRFKRNAGAADALLILGKWLKWCGVM